MRALRTRSLSLTADPAESGEGDTVTFTGVLDSRTANVQATWSWVSDTAGGREADRSRGLARIYQQSGLGQIRDREGWPRGGANFDFVPNASDTTMVNAADSATLDAPGFGPGATAPCTTNTLMCATAMYGAGTMTLVANIYGREVSSSAHAGVRYTAHRTFRLKAFRILAI